MPRQLITPPVPRLLGPLHAAAFLGLTPGTFEKLWQSNQLPQPYSIGKSAVWDIKALELFVDGLADEQARSDDRW